MTRKTFTSLICLYTAILAMVAIGLAACGGATSRDDVTVRRYEDFKGDPTPNSDSLGFTYFGSGDGAKHEAKGYNCLINEDLATDDDADRMARVIVHELLNVLFLSDDTKFSPPGYGDDWYLADGDSRDPFYAIPASEAAWIAEHGTFHVRIDGDWLRDATIEAAGRINDAAGRVVFEVKP